MGGASKNSVGGAFRNHNNVPVKVCATCERPFTWRKKWEKNWDDITTCSQRCKTERKSKNGRTAAIATGTASFAAARTSKKAGTENESTSDEGSATEDQNVRSPASDTSFDADTAVFSTECGIPEASSALKGLGLIEAHADDLEDSDDAQDANCFYTDVAVNEDQSAITSNSREARRLHKKDVKAKRRALREGDAAETKKKPCSKCTRLADLLVRCTLDAAQDWHMVCGKCWKEVSGGVPDGDDAHPHYRYGGLWKNRAAHISMPAFSTTKLSTLESGNDLSRLESANSLRVESGMGLCARA